MCMRDEMRDERLDAGGAARIPEKDFLAGVSFADFLMTLSFEKRNAE